MEDFPARFAADVQAPEGEHLNSASELNTGWNLFHGMVDVGIRSQRLAEERAREPDAVAFYRTSAVAERCKERVESLSLLRVRTNLLVASIKTMRREYVVADA